MIIWNNNNGGKQTADLTFTMRGLYTMSGYKSLVTKICEGGDTGETPEQPEQPEQPETPVLDGTMCLTSTAERAVFFTKPSSWGSNINCYVWYNGSTQVLGAWPGTAATDLGNGNYKMVMPESAPAIDNTWMIIWNDGSNQTNDLTFVLHGLWTGNDRNSIKQTGTITEICKNDTTAIETPSEETTQGDGWFYDILGRRYAYPTHPGIYIRNGQKILVH